MRIVETGDDEATIIISFDDLAFLHQGMREMLQALDDNELRILTRKTREQARALMNEIEKVCEVIDSPR